MSTSPVPTLLESFRAHALSQGLTNRKSKAYKEQRRLWLADKVTTGFAEQFGADVYSLSNWKKLCVTIGIEGASGFTSITQCQESLKGKYINLVDLVDAANADKVIIKPNPFPDPKKLAKYIVRTEKVYPLNRAKSNPLLRQFLISVRDNLGRRKKGKKGRKNPAQKPGNSSGAQ
ncbi:hypothetical protein VNI00_011247 [Paramarasmius palmivorus]|uniref:Transposase n=1 Tax=Paramarasmius palmivorus TaxID=297713 RepID=A0AAW0CGJ3_9AGAR